LRQKKIILTPGDKALEIVCYGIDTSDLITAED